VSTALINADGVTKSRSREECNTGQARPVNMGCCPGTVTERGCIHRRL